MSRCSIPLAAAVLAMAAAAPACAQVARSFPADALRGEATFGVAPDLTLDGKPQRLAPGSRIHGLDNMLVMSGALVGKKATVNYTLDTYGLLHDVWLLREDESKKLWPKTRAEAAAWSFDPIGQIWVKP